MLRKKPVSNEGLHQEVSEIAGTESSEHASGSLVISPLRGGAGDATVESGSQACNTSSTATDAECRPDDEPELDPHICKQWPCPQCHKPRDASDDEMSPKAAQHSAEDATSTQSFVESSLQMNRTEDSDNDDDDDDLLLDIVGRSAAHVTQNHKRHCK